MTGVLASHIIFTNYGFWLPNDPRGSGSDYVRRRELYDFGQAVKVTRDTRRSVAKSPHDRVKRQAAKSALRFQPVEWINAQICAIGRGMKLAVEESKYSVFAMAVLRDHTHVVVGRHAHDPRLVMRHLKGRGSSQLIAESRHPFAGFVEPDEELPSPWAQRGWTVFLDEEEDVSRAIRYVERNLVWARMKQRWSFVRDWVRSNEV